MDEGRALNTAAGDLHLGDAPAWVLMIAIYETVMVGSAWKYGMK